MDIKRALTPVQRTTSEQPKTDSANLKLNQTLQIKSIQAKDEVQQGPIQADNDKTQQKLVETIRQILPIQQAPAELIKQLTDNLYLINTKNIPDTLKQLAKAILNSTPQLQEIDNNEQVKKLFSQSGLFLEAKLAQNRQNELQSDLKNLLLKFQHALKLEIDPKQQQKLSVIQLDLIKEMMKKTEGGLAKILLNQLASLPKDDGNRQIWILDIPFLHQQKIENFRLEINREKKPSNNDDSESWSVDITVTPPGFATIHCKISYSHQIINTVFFSEDTVAVNKINQHLDHLKIQLENAGLTLGHLSANHGVSSAPELPPGLKQQNLFDQKA